MKLVKLFSAPPNPCPCPPRRLLGAGDVVGRLRHRHALRRRIDRHGSADHGQLRADRARVPRPAVEDHLRGFDLLDRSRDDRPHRRGPGDLFGQRRGAERLADEHDVRREHDRGEASHDLPGGHRRNSVLVRTIQPECHRGEFFLCPLDGRGRRDRHGHGRLRHELQRAIRGSVSAIGRQRLYVDFRRADGMHPVSRQILRQHIPRLPLYELGSLDEPDRDRRSNLFGDRGWQ